VFAHFPHLASQDVRLIEDPPIHPEEQQAPDEVRQDSCPRRAKRGKGHNAHGKDWRRHLPPEQIKKIFAQ
jgi:hypothetical protein